MKFLVNIVLPATVVCIIIVITINVLRDKNQLQIYVAPTIGNEEIVDNKQNNSRLRFTDKQSKFMHLLLNEDINKYINYKDAGTLYRDIIKDRNIVKVKASKLFNDYHSNEIKADNLYRDKEIILTGTISSIDRSIGNNYYLSLSTNEMFYTVQAHFGEEYKSILAELTKGQKYTMHCMGNGMLIQSPILKNCKPIQVWIDSEVESLFFTLSRAIDSNKSIKEMLEDKKGMQAFILIGGFILALNEDSPLLDSSDIDKKEKLFETEVKEFSNFIQKITPQIKEQNLGVKDVIHLYKEHKKINK